MSDLFFKKDFKVTIFKYIEWTKEVMVKGVIESMTTISHITEDINKQIWNYKKKTKWKLFSWKIQ